MARCRFSQRSLLRGNSKDIIYELLGRKTIRERFSAADWFGDLWDEFPIPSKVEETLELDLEDNLEEIRAAAHMLVQLGETLIWPVDSIDRHCDLAARRLEEIKALADYSGDDFQAQLQKEIDILRSRISKDFNRNNG